MTNTLCIKSMCRTFSSFRHMLESYGSLVTDGHHGRGGTTKVHLLSTFSSLHYLECSKLTYYHLE